MEKKLRLKYPLVVEGRYDKSKVSLVVESSIICLDGFSVFNNAEKQQLLKRLSRSNGIILLTDSDRAGNFIRAKLKGILSGKIFNVYAPSVIGKERRKKHPSADGLLGVEGIDTSTLRDLLMPFADDTLPCGANITKTKFYSDGLSGGDNSAELRKKLARELGFPKTLSANALLEAINLLVSAEEYEAALSRITNE